MCVCAAHAVLPHLQIAFAGKSQNNVKHNEKIIQTKCTPNDHIAGSIEVNSFHFSAIFFCCFRSRTTVSIQFSVADYLTNFKLYFMQFSFEKNGIAGMARNENKRETFHAAPHAQRNAISTMDETTHIRLNGAKHHQSYHIVPMWTFIFFVAIFVARLWNLWF